MIEEAKKISNRKISLVGILKRADVGLYFESKRIGVNERLRKMCEQSGVEYIEYNLERSRLARDGLHLNHLGQDELAKSIFDHCKSFLV